LPSDTSAVASFAGFAERLCEVLAETGRERLDLLVNNAGTGLHAVFADTTEEQLDEMIDVHLKGVFFLTQRLLPLLADGASIVNVSSGLTRFSHPAPRHTRSPRAAWRCSPATSQSSSPTAASR